jgi:hypothetical protein
MATAAQYRQWMVDNADKQGTESYAAIKDAYDLVSREEADSGASPGPLRVTVPTANNYAAWLENNRDLEGTEDYTAVQQALALTTEPVATVDVPPSAVAPPETTAEGVAGAIGRGLAPTAAFAGLGAALGGPPGALAGAAVPVVTQLVGDPVVMGVNALLGTQFDTPSVALENLLTSIGVPEARTATERVLQTTAGAVGGGAGMIGLGRTMAQSARPVIAGIGEALAAQPAAQLAGSATGGAAAQGTAEAGGGPLAQFGVGLLGGAGGAAAVMRPTAAVPRPVPAAAVDNVPQPVQTGAVIREDNIFRGVGTPKVSVDATNKPFVVRGTTQNQIDDMIASGLVRPKPGGYGKDQKATIYFGESDEALPTGVFARPTPDRYVLVGESGKIVGREGNIPIDSLQHVWHEVDGQVIDVLPDILSANRAATTPTAAPTRAAPPVAGPAAVAPMSGEQLAATTRSATGAVFGKTAAQRILAEQAAPDPRTVAAAERLGIQDYLQPDHVTTNQAFRELSQAVKSVPGSVLRAKEMDGLNEVGQRADNLIRELGGTTDLSRVQSRVKDGLGKTIDDLETQAGRLYDKITSALPATATVEADNVLAFLNRQITDLGGKENLSPMEKTLLAKLSPKADGTLPTYALVDQQRKAIGRAAKQAGPFADEDTALAGKYYGLLTDDQAMVAETFGQAATWKAAKDLVSVRKGLEDDMIALFGKQLDQSLVGKLSDATVSLSKGDAEKLSKLMQAIPQQQRQMVAASALNTAFGKATQNGALNFNTFANWYEGLLANKQAYAALVTNLPMGARKQLSDLYRVSRGVRNATRERITTGRINAVTEELKGADTAMAQIYDKAKRAALGVPIELAATTIGVPPGFGLGSGITAALLSKKENTIKAADALIASPEFEKMVVDMARNGGTARPASVSILQNSRAFKAYAKAVGLRGTLAELQALISGQPQEDNAQ